MTVPFIPDSAPFTPQQRAWLNGFFAGVFGAAAGANDHGLANGSSNRSLNGAAAMLEAATSTGGGAAVAEAEGEAEEDFPWHDPALTLDERLKLAEDKPLERRLMASMAQLDCGACGYVCKTYSEAIATGAESDLTKCSPGGSDTMKMLKKLVAETKAAKNATANGDVTNGHVANGAAVAKNGAAKVDAAVPGSSRSKPLVARLIETRRLTHVDAPKDTRHVMIDLGASGLAYEPGDALGVLPSNCPDLVNDVLAAYGATGDEPVSLQHHDLITFRTALSKNLALNKLRPTTLELLATSATDAAEREQLRKLTSDDVDDPFLDTADVLDALEQFRSARPPVQEFVATLGTLQPRLYSISSSLRKHPSQVHLTIGIVQFESLGRTRHGVASNYLGVRSQPGDEVRVYVQHTHFRLPQDPNTPVVMVGPGTGVAPFRAFLEEREATGAKGRNWLFFGNQYIDYDYLYREEIDRWADNGLLTRLDVAFSRDGANKVYVQDRMRESGAELWNWLEAGAYFYVCGDAKRMAVDVEAALREIIVEHGGRTAADAKQYLTALVKAKRYQKDVY